MLAMIAGVGAESARPMDSLDSVLSFAQITFSLNDTHDPALTCHSANFSTM